MKRYSQATPIHRGVLLAVAALVLSGIARSASAEETYNWTLVTKDAGWQVRDSQGEVVFDDQLWIFGGWFTSHEAPPRDVWSSTDGKTWKEITPHAPWIHSDLSMSIAFKDRMWFMGGWYNGRLPGHSASNSVWSSTNGKEWKQETPAAGWSPRLASAVVEFKGRIWILGGTENYYFGDEKSLKNDVWSSADGRTWELATNSAPWAPRAYHQAAVLNDRIYVFGGGNYVPEYRAFNDVWSSADGIEWRQETASAPWTERLWFSSVVYRDRMWVMGGWSNSPKLGPDGKPTGAPVDNLGDVWYSHNGRDWTELKSDTIWKSRHEHSAYVFQDRIWIAGGHARPLSNEVWSLELPANWGKD